MKWTIGTKIGSGFALALAFLLLIGIVCYQSTVKLIEASVWVEHTHRVLAQLDTALIGLMDGESCGRGYVISGDEKSLEPCEGARERSLQAISTVRTLTADNAQQQSRLAKLEPLAISRFSAIESAVDLRRRSGFEAAAKDIVDHQGPRLMSEVRRLITQMQDDERGLLAQRADEEASRARLTELTILVAICVAVIILGVVAGAITLSISRPLALLSTAAQRIASGNLESPLPSQARSDEVGTLTTSFQQMRDWLNRMSRVATRIAEGDLTERVEPLSSSDSLGSAFAAMQERLRRTTGELHDAAGVLATSASEILAATTQMSASATESAAAVTETTTTVEEVKQTAQLSSQKARLVSENAQKSAQTSQDGKRAVEQAIGGMQRIQEQMGSIAETVVKLSEQSQAIGDIIATVTDLAEQSNLLAVNAGIEAARAGDQGKGFAVVAQEVKSLAEQSKQATTQVRSILNDIQRAIGSAVMATEQGGKSVESGVQQSQDAADSIRQLSDIIETGAQAAMQIAASSQQQAIGMDQVALAMENIKQASMQNVSGTKQAELAAKNLHDTGQKLRDLTGRFRL